MTRPVDTRLPSAPHDAGMARGAGRSFRQGIAASQPCWGAPRRLRSAAMPTHDQRLPASSAARARVLGLVALLGASLVGCETGGRPPPSGQLFFPTAMAIGPTGDVLYVANSNFDLRFNRGSLHSYDLARLNELMDACPALVADPSNRITSAGECQVLPLELEDRLGELRQEDVRFEAILIDQVQTGSFADGIALSPEGGRLYLPMRGDANLTFVNTDASGDLSCGGDPSSGFERCSAEFARVDESLSRARDLDLPNDPVGVVAGPFADLLPPGSAPAAGTYVLFAHRGGSASLFVDGDQPDRTQPRLLSTLDGLGALLVDVTFDRASGFGWLASASTLGVARFGVGVELLEAGDGAFAQIERTQLYRARTLVFEDLDTSRGFGDVRALAADPRPDVRRAYLLNRTPNTLLVADPEVDPDQIRILRRVPVGLGPSKLTVEEFPAEGRTLAFVSCFDSQDVWVVDVDLGVLVGIVRNLGGPFEITVDVPRQRAYVLDFVASTVRFIDLAPMFACLRGDLMAGDECSPRLLGLLGRPAARDELN